MWPKCIDNLKPFPVKLDEEIPSELLAAFRQTGWPNLPQAFPVKMVALLGTCSTDQYRECPTLPDWHIENAEEDEGFLEEIGRYYWCDFDLIDKNGQHTPLRMAFNEGDADCNDGCWGMVWDRNTATPIAELTSVGDCEGSIKLISQQSAKGFTPHSFPVPGDNKSFESFRLPFTLVYGSDAEFEKLVAVAMRWCMSCRRKKN